MIVAAKQMISSAWMKHLPAGSKLATNSDARSGRTPAKTDPPEYQFKSNEMLIRTNSMTFMMARLIGFICSHYVCNRRTATLSFNLIFTVALHIFVPCLRKECHRECSNEDGTHNLENVMRKVTRKRHWPVHVCGCVRVWLNFDWQSSVRIQPQVACTYNFHHVDTFFIVRCGRKQQVNVSMHSGWRILYTEMDSGNSNSGLRENKIFPMIRINDDGRECAVMHKYLRSSWW